MEEGAEAEIWSVTDITEEELDEGLKTDEEEGEMDVVAALLELAEWAVATPPIRDRSVDPFPPANGS